MKHQDVIVKLEKKLDQFEDYEKQMLDPEIAGNPQRYATLARDHGRLAKSANKYRRYKELTAQVRETRDMLESENDPEMKSYAEAELEEMQTERTAIWKELNRLSSTNEKVDSNNLIMEIRAGTGGDEAALFARDLYEMYTRYAATKGWKCDPINLSTSEIGGFKEVTFSIQGDSVYNELQYESGGHRVQRVPETETQGRIHTSAATVAVLPEPTTVEIDIRTDDLRVDTMRSGGPGGQHQNKTESGVRITHLPTNIVVNCRDEKSQHKNRAKAMRVLKSRLFDRMLEEEMAQRDDQRRNQIGSGDRSQRIRTYNFPQNRITDHRIGLNLYQLDSIIAGELQAVIDALQNESAEDELPPPA